MILNSITRYDHLHVTTAVRLTVHVKYIRQRRMKAYVKDMEANSEYWNSLFSINSMNNNNNRLYEILSRVLVTCIRGLDR
jgi:hypothetical protein